MARNMKRLIVPTIDEILNHGASVFHTGLAGGASGEGVAPAGHLTRPDIIPTVSGTGVTVDGQPLADIWADFNARVAAFNQVADAQTALLTFPVTRAQEKVGVPTNPGMQQATELGKPSKIRVKWYKRGFPIEHYDLGTGYTQEFLDEASGQQIAQVAAEVEMAYALLRQEITLEALFTSANLTDEDGIAVKRLYNADGEIPPRWKRWTFDGTHTHYQATAGASLAEADFDTLEEHLVHHGFTKPFVVHAHRDDLADIRALTTFVPAESSDRPVITTGAIVGPTTGSSLPGFPAQGYVGPFTIVNNDLIPSGYLLAQAFGGLLGTRNPVGLRVHENPSVRGLRLLGGRTDYPLIDSVYDCYLGAGVGQRGAAVVMQITAGAYTSPTFETG